MSDDMEAATQFPYKGAISGKASPRGKGDSHVVCLDGKADVPADIELVVTPNPVADEHLVNAKGGDLHKVNQNSELPHKHDEDEPDECGHKNKSSTAKFDFQRTISFWSATLFFQGSILFTIGSIVMYPAILRGQVNHESRVIGA